MNDEGVGLGEETPRRRRRRGLVLGLVAVAVVLWAATAAFALLGARRDSNAGLESIRAAQRAASPKELLDGRALEHLDDGGRSFRSAERRLDGPALKPLRLLPVLGRQLRSATALAGAAADVSDIGKDAVRAARQALRQPHGTGPERIALLRELAELAGDAEQRLRDVDTGPSRALFDPLTERRAELVDRLDDLRASLRDGRVVASGLADIMQGPRRYLVLAANNAEMRAGSGMFLSVGELTFVAGDFQLGDFRSSADLYVEENPPPITDVDDARNWGWLNANREWRNLGASPRFDATAELASRMWTATGGAPVDGVLALDPLALRAVLRATGPVRVGDTEVHSGNVVDLLLHDQYVSIDSQADQAQAGRREQHGLISKATMGALQAGGWETATLASELTGAARGRHLLAWSGNAEEQKVWRTTRLSGSLDEDSLLLSVLNRGGNKLDRFLDVDARIAMRSVGRETEVEVRVGLHNRTPEGESLYIAGPFPGSGVGAGDYTGLVSLNVPGFAGALTSDVDSPAAAGADGPTRVLAVPVTVRRGETTTMTFRFRVAGQRGSFRVISSARAPAVRWTAPGQQWSDHAPRTVSWG